MFCHVLLRSAADRCGELRAAIYDLYLGASSTRRSPTSWRRSLPCIARSPSRTSGRPARGHKLGCSAPTSTARRPLGRSWPAAPARSTRPSSRPGRRRHSAPTSRSDPPSDRGGRRVAPPRQPPARAGAGGPASHRQPHPARTRSAPSPRRGPRRPGDRRPARHQHPHRAQPRRAHPQQVSKTTPSSRPALRAPPWNRRRALRTPTGAPIGTGPGRPPAALGRGGDLRGGDGCRGPVARWRTRSAIIPRRAPSSRSLERSRHPLDGHQVSTCARSMPVSSASCSDDGSGPAPRRSTRIPQTRTVARRTLASSRMQASAPASERLAQWTTSGRLAYRRVASASRPLRQRAPCDTAPLPGCCPAAEAEAWSATLSLDRRPASRPIAQSRRRNGDAPLGGRGAIRLAWAQAVRRRSVAAARMSASMVRPSTTATSMAPREPSAPASPSLSSAS
jgi:hypothetical protein